MSATDQHNLPKTDIHTDGGAIVGKDVQAGGDFIGRDSNEFSGDYVEGNKIEIGKIESSTTSKLALAGAIVIVVIAILGITLASIFPRPLPTVVPTMTIEVTPALAPLPKVKIFSSDRLGILIADFCDGIPEPNCIASAKGRELARLVETDLQQRLSKSPQLTGKIEIQRSDTFTNAKAAADAGLQFHATLVIWGWILSSEDNAISTRFIPINPLISADTDNIGGLVGTLWIDANITGSDTVNVGTQVALRASVAAEFITGFLLVLNNNMRDAISEYSEAIKATNQYLDALPIDDPRRTDAQRGLAALYVFRGTALGALAAHSADDYVYAIDESRKDFEEAIKLDKDLTVAYVNLGNLDFVQNDYASAEYYYEQAKSKGPKVASVYIGLGNLEFEQKKYSEARESYDKAVDLAGNGGRELMQAHYLRGIAHLALNNVKEAIDDFQYILDIEASPPDLRFLAQKMMGVINTPGATPYLEVITPIATPAAPMPQPTLPRP